MREKKAGDGHRDFPGRGLLINILRVFHIGGLAGLSAVVLGGAGGAAQWGGTMLISGLGIIALDAWANPFYFRQVKGLGTLLKIALVVLLVVWEPGRLALFWFVLVFSVLLSHAPGSLRHRQLF
ncbi:MAG: hypothetical protein FIA96_08845 [Betaproteobacteria bacterium]|nr:hypothetical protein [Betaproteobacteria bacterium]